VEVHADWTDITKQRFNYPCWYKMKVSGYTVQVWQSSGDDWGLDASPLWCRYVGELRARLLLMMSREEVESYVREKRYERG